jgi:hypothetical protein
LPQSSTKGHPEKHTVVPQKGDEKLLLETVVMERGVKGMLPLGCLLRWGREGVTPHSLFKM